MIIELDTLLPAVVKEILLKGSGPNINISFSDLSKSVKENKVNIKRIKVSIYNLMGPS